MDSATNLRFLVQQFLYNCNPSSKSNDEFCTVGDLRNAAIQLADLLNAFIDELEND